MGVLPAALEADRIVVCWEHTYLSIALEVPGAHGLPPGLVMLDADRTDHEVRFPPFLLATAPDDDCASPVAVPEWGPVTRSVGSAPPEPVWRLLRIWQTQPVSDEDTTQTPANLERCQRMFWTQQRSAGAVRHCILGCAGQCSMLRSSSQPCS